MASDSNTNRRKGQRENTVDLAACLVAIPVAHGTITAMVLRMVSPRPHGPTSRPSAVLAAICVLLGSCFASPAARCATFDEAGRLVYDSRAVVAEGFEQGDADIPPGNDDESTAGVREFSPALDGTHVLEATLRGDGLPISLQLPHERHSFSLSLWVRGDCRAGVAVDDENGTPHNVAFAFPTGRMTSDGWTELRTAPFAFDGASGWSARLFLAGYDSDVLQVLVDAVEVVPTGAFMEPKACDSSADRSSCGPDRICIEGRCVSSAGWFPPLPNSQERAGLVDTWSQRVRISFGPYMPRRVWMPEALKRWQHAQKAQSATEFWMDLAALIRGLGDAHTYARTSATKALALTRPLNACFFEGTADLTQNVWPSDHTYHDVLVSHTGEQMTWGLAQGDRLVSVDGLPPLLWAEKLIDTSLWAWRADDPKHYANLASNLNRLIPLHAKTIQVIHCHLATSTCDEHVDTIRVADIPRLAPGQEPKLVKCDNRPFYHIEGAPKDHDFGSGLDEDEMVVLEGPLKESNENEALRGLVWNSLLGGWPASPVDAKLRAAIGKWNALGTPGLVLDHREGHGGTSATANIVASIAVEPTVALVSLFRTRADDEGPADPEEGRAIFHSFENTHAALEAGSPKANTSRPVALLLTWDVSASDFLPFMMKGAPSVRLFGPGPTMGAFGTFVQYSYWGQVRWSIGIQDSIASSGLSLCGRGVMPDEIVLPRQSDLLAGKDTVHEAALRWIRQELAK